MSYGFALTGITLDVLAVNRGDMHPAKGILNTAMTGVGLFGGPVGWTIAGGYFLIDATIGWDNAFQSMDNITRRNQAIHGASWSPYGRGPK